jgi:putative endonuclease
MSGGDIYILGSHTGTLYIGVTSNLYSRVMQHKEGALKEFTADYGCKRLLYFEGYQDAEPSLGKNNSKAGGAKRSSTSFARSIPSSKTLHTPGDGR